MSAKILKTSDELRKFFDARLTETTPTRAKLYNAAVYEREQQELTAKSLSKLSTDSDSDIREEADDDEKSATVASAEKAADDSLENIIDRLNSIRAGKSLKDPKISKNFEEYYDSLKKTEKIALSVFLHGISQVLTGEVSGEGAVAPHEPPTKMQMMKTKTVNIKPNVIKKGTAAKSADGGSPPAETPIKPKIKQK